MKETALIFNRTDLMNPERLTREGKWYGIERVKRSANLDWFSRHDNQENPGSSSAASESPGNSETNLTTSYLFKRWFNLRTTASKKFVAQAIRLGFLVLSVTISIVDLPHRPKDVLIEACYRDTVHCTRVVVPRTNLEDDRAVEAIAKHLEQQLKF